MGARVRTGAVGIVTPEAVLLELEVADYGSRLAARAIDTLIQAGTLGALLLLVSLATLLFGSLTRVVVIVAGMVATFAMLFAYPALCEHLMKGRTIGKRALGLRVMTIEGGPVRFRHCATRAALAILDVYPGGLLASLSMLFDVRCRRLGDLVAGTIVVREKGATQNPSAVWFPPPPNWEPYVHQLPVAMLTAVHYEMVRNFLLRAPDLTLAARYSLATRISERISQRIGVLIPPGATPELWLACVASAWQRQTIR